MAGFAYDSPPPHSSSCVQWSQEYSWREAVRKAQRPSSCEEFFYNVRRWSKFRLNPPSAAGVVTNSFDTSSYAFKLLCTNAQGFFHENVFSGSELVR